MLALLALATLASSYKIENPGKVICGITPFDANDVHGWMPADRSTTGVAFPTGVDFPSDPDDMATFAWLASQDGKTIIPAAIEGDAIATVGWNNVFALNSAKTWVRCPEQ